MAVTTQAKTDIIDATVRGVIPAWMSATTSYLALLTADPTASGSFASEANYTGYARVAIDRDADFTTAGIIASNTNLVQFPQASGGSSLCTYFAICSALTGGTMQFYSPLGESLSVVSPIQPQFKTGTLQNQVL